MSWIEGVCPRCEWEGARLRAALIGSLLCAGVLFLPLCAGLRAGLPDASPFEAARVTLYVLAGVVLSVLAAAAFWRGRAQRSRRAGAVAAGYVPAPSRPVSAGERALLAWGIVGVALVAFALGAEVARHGSAGARDPLILAWLTLVEDWEFGGLRVWKWLLGLYLGLSCVGGVLWFQVLDRYSLRRTLRNGGGE